MTELFGELPNVSKKKDKEYEVVSEKGQKVKVVYKPLDFVPDAQVIPSITKVVNLLESKELKPESERWKRNEL